MRLHRLEITAFGPFGGHQRIDFDELAESGLFLLHGPTGAGKTTVLDAVCFALFNKVPGARATAGRLRSDHAAEGVVPEVVCEVTLADRRFEITRTAEWWRPKRRGTGLIKEQPHVVLRELVGGQWQPVTHRIDETADLIHRLTGLGVDQFTKLVLLPQGEFATFLRASAEERRPLLQKLFGTQRFEAVEAWLRDRRRELQHEVTAARQRTELLVDRAEQAFLTLDVDGTAEVSVESEPRERVIAWRELARASAGGTHAELTTAEAEQAAAERRLAAGEQQLAARTRHGGLTEQLAALEQQQAGHRQLAQQVEAATKAAVLAPLLGDLTAAEAAAAQLATAAEAAAQQVIAREPGGAPSELLTTGLAAARVESLDAHLAATGEQAEQAQQLHELEAELDAGGRRLTDLREQQRTVVAARDESTAALAATEAALAPANALAAQAPGRAQERQRSRQVLKSAREAERLQTRLQARERRVREAFEAYRKAAEHVLDLRSRRLEGMAAELAAELTDEAPCPVCGAAEHPHPAIAVAEQVSAADEEEATARRDALQAESEAVTRERDRIDRDLAARRAAAGGASVAEAETALAAATLRQREAEEAAVRAAELESQRLRLRAAIAADQERLEGLELQVRRAEQERAEASGRRSQLLGRLTGVAVGESAAGAQESLQLEFDWASVLAELPARHAALLARRSAWAGLAEAVDASSVAAEHCQRLRRSAQNAALDAGFGDLEAARAALLPEQDAAALRRRVREHDDALAGVRSLLADPQLQAAIAAPEPEIGALREATAAARRRRQSAADAQLLASRAVSTLTVLVTDLEHHLLATQPLRERYALVDQLSHCADGTGDNRLKMRLSSYVLAARLEQVAAAAGVRLAAMTGGRFTLRHTDGPARGGARTGLGLLVLDAWTGVERDPATLSGGETFCTSLALALGLADVVSAEAGGTRLETLLVDEGFGSLDDETLEQVLDVVDGLRSGGRTVGLVSHVADLRQRIPAQLEVLKTPSGSTVRQSIATPQPA